jgi:aminoglycoside phosphotransferase (APT) family kinase protein
MSASPIDPILDLVPVLARRERRVTVLPGGLTNTNYRVDVGGRSYVVRVSSKDSSLLAIDREHEYHASVSAAETGVGARVVDYLP